jgi:hypothetical protein
MTEWTALTKYETACRALAEARSVDEVKDIRDRAVALRVYAKQARNKGLEADALEIRLRAERRVGEMMAHQKERDGLNEGGRPKTGFSGNPVSDKPTLAEAGIDKNLAHRARTLAAMPEPDFEDHVSDARDDVVHPPVPKMTRTGSAEAKRLEGLRAKCFNDFLSEADPETFGRRLAEDAADNQTRLDRLRRFATAVLAGCGRAK